MVLYLEACIFSSTQIDIANGVSKLSDSGWKKQVRKFKRFVWQQKQIAEEDGLEHIACVCCTRMCM